MLTVWDGRAKTCAFKSKKALIKREKQWGKGMAGIDTVKVLAGRQAAVSPGSFSNPGLLCLVCVCVCVYAHTIGLGSDTTVDHMGLSLFAPFAWSMAFLTNMLSLFHAAVY